MESGEPYSPGAGHRRIQEGARRPELTRWPRPDGGEPATREDRSSRECPAIDVVCGKPTPAAGRARGSAGYAGTARFLSAPDARTRPTGPRNWTGAPGALACTWSSGWVRSSAGTAGRSWRLRAGARRAWRTTRPVRPSRMSPARPGRPWRVSRACGAGPALEGAGRGADLSEEVARALDRVLGRSLVSQSIQRAPDPEGTAGPGAAGPGAGSAGSRAASAGSRGRGGVGRPGLSPGITRRPIQRRSGTGRPGRVPPGPMRPAWMPSGLVRLRGDPAG